jgi:hypothetical protein
MMKKGIGLVALFIWTCSGYGQKTTPFSTVDYVRALKHATDVMVNDATSPVAAARYYAYINLAANEIVGLFDEEQPHFSGIVKGLNKLTIPDSLTKNSEPHFAIILTLYKTATRLLPSGFLLNKRIDSIIEVAKQRKLSPGK